MSGAETDPDLVQLLSGWLSGTGITELDLRTPTGRIRLKRAGTRDGEGAPAPAAAAQEDRVTVTAPGAGVFLDRHPLQTTPLLSPGQAVRAGDVVGLLRVGSLLRHVVAPATGTVAEVVAPAGSTVGYGAPLMHLQRMDGE